jgi:hypothetical protein
MPYSERAYFEGDHCHHCAAWDDKRLADRRKAQARQFGRERRKSCR